MYFDFLKGDGQTTELNIFCSFVTLFLSFSVNRSINQSFNQSPVWTQRPLTSP